MSPSQLLIGYMAGGVVRSLLIGVLTLGAARLFVDFPMEHPAVLALVLVGTSVAFTALGTVVGLYSTGWDQQNVVGNLVIQPLVFLGGVFYSITASASRGRADPRRPDLLHGGRRPARRARRLGGGAGAVARRDARARGRHDRLGLDGRSCAAWGSARRVRRAWTPATSCAAPGSCTAPTRGT